MPRVVQDQKTKFETDEIFKKLSLDVDVKYTAYKERPAEERKRKFVEDLHEGHSVVTFVPTGTNLSLQFCPRGLSDDKPPDTRPSTETVNFDQEPNRVHLKSNFIMNGVCVRWVGWIDLEQLTGKARLIYDEDTAKSEDDIMRRVMKETQDRVRMYEDNHRRWQQEQQQMQSPPPLQPNATDL